MRFLWRVWWDGTDRVSDDDGGNGKNWTVYKERIWRTYLCRIWLFTGRFFCRTACSTRKYPHGVWYFRWFRFRPVGKVFGKADDETDDAGFLSVYREWWDENSFHEKENGQDAGGGQWLYQSVYGYDKDAGCRYEPYYKKKRRKSVLLRPHYTAAGSDRPVRNADTYFICP